jgi:hypothetical protein
LAWLNPSIPISWPGRVLRTPAGPLTSRLPPDTSGVRRHLSVDLEAHLLVVPASRLCLHLPAPIVLAALLVAVAVSRSGRCCRVRGLPACQHADHLPPEALERVSDIERRRRRPGLRLLCVSGPWPNRAWTSCDNPTLCAPLSASQNKVLSCWEIAVEGCGRSRIVK